MKVGDKVIVRTYSGSLVTRRVAAETDEGILICTEEEYLAAAKEQREPQGIGWPKDHILEAVAD